MNSYTPFLKFKAGEIGALKALEHDELSSITPFFDLATKKGITSYDVEKTIVKGIRKYELNFKNANRFYIDDYDLDDSLKINGKIVYEFLIQTFKDLPYIPVVGLDRTPDRVSSVSSSLISSDTLALRLNQEDFISYSLVEDDIKDILEPLADKYPKIHLILDCRVCFNADTTDLASKLIQFILAISHDYEFEKIIITGSSIPASIADLLPVSSEKTVKRKESQIFDLVFHELGNKVEIGDYTTVSPDYSDVNIPQNALRKIMTPKVIYSYDKNQYFSRGGAIETHIRGAKQYDDMCLTLTNKSFFRGAVYSTGDEYIDKKSKGVGKDAQPHSIGKYLINAHMTFMLNNY